MILQIKNGNKNRNEINNEILLILISSVAITVTSLLLPSSVHAAISCSTCFVDNCPCIVGLCSSGIFSVYNNSACSGNPIFEYTFNARTVPWSPDTAGRYWAQAYCDDGTTKESCTSISVNSIEQTTTTSEESQTPTTTSTETGGGGDNTIWMIIAVIIVVGIIGFLIYWLFFSKKKKKRGGTYEELYRKWVGPGPSR